MGERYVRPPLMAREAPSARWALWRFRLVATVVAVLLVAAAVYAVRASGLGVQDTGGGVSEQPQSSTPLDSPRR